jgi:DNA polymerase II small subunit
MENEILKFCFERGLLVDKDILELFKGEDLNTVKVFIEKIKNTTNQNVITKNTLVNNKDKFNKIISTLPKENQRKLETLKIKLGLSIEISKEISIEKEISEEFSLNKEENHVNVFERPIENISKLEIKHFINHFKNRFVSFKNILQEHSELTNLVSINKISDSRQSISIIGMIREKSTTKNKNIILEVEDLTGNLKVLINQNKPDLYKQAEEIALDSVLGFKGSGNREIFFANEMVFPEARLSERKKSPKEEYALFIGDLHFGSKKFMKENFMDFIDYLNGKLPNSNPEEINKIKYLFIVGDVVTGVGNYPDQEKDLEINNLEDQFLALAELLSKIREDIKIIISPGNHDGVRIMEPQPLFSERFAWPLYNMKNVVLTENPGRVNIGANKGFEGFNVLTYHGFSFTYYAGIIPSLILGRAMNSPHEIMKYLLKNRHLAPTHGSTQYFPLENDPLIIDKVPDIFVSAHTHKCATDYFNNILVISTSCWEEMTSYQEKFGNKPDHCKVPMLNLETHAIKILDFE